MRFTAISLTAVVFAVCCAILLAQTVASRLTPSGVIDLADSEQWLPASGIGAGLLAHQVPGGWMVRAAGQEAENAMFLPDPGHAWRKSPATWQKSEMIGQPVWRQAVPGGWLAQRMFGRQLTSEPFFVPDAEHDGIFESQTELIFAVNGFDTAPLMRNES